jgi:hypothetical protein
MIAASAPAMGRHAVQSNANLGSRDSTQPFQGRRRDSPQLICHCASETLRFERQ